MFEVILVIIPLISEAAGLAVSINTIWSIIFKKKSMYVELKEMADKIRNSSPNTIDTSDVYHLAPIEVTKLAELLEDGDKIMPSFNKKIARLLPIFIFLTIVSIFSQGLLVFITPMFTVQSNYLNEMRVNFVIIITILLAIAYFLFTLKLIQYYFNQDDLKFLRNLEGLHELFYHNTTRILIKSFNTGAEDFVKKRDIGAEGFFNKMKSKVDLAIFNTFEVPKPIIYSKDYKYRIEKHINAGKINLKNNNYEEAIEKFDSAIKIIKDYKLREDPYFAEPFYYKGNALKERSIALSDINDMKKAFNCLKCSIRINPEHEFARQMLEEIEQDRKYIFDENDLDDEKYKCY